MKYMLITCVEREISTTLHDSVESAREEMFSDMQSDPRCPDDLDFTQAACDDAEKAGWSAMSGWLTGKSEWDWLIVPVDIKTPAVVTVVTKDGAILKVHHDLGNLIRFKWLSMDMPGTPAQEAAAKDWLKRVKNLPVFIPSVTTPIECDSETCVFNPNGYCWFHAMYGREPVLTDDGCSCWTENPGFIVGAGQNSGVTEWEDKA